MVGDREAVTPPPHYSTRAAYAYFGMTRIPQITYFYRTWITRVSAHSPNRVEGCFSEICVTEGFWGMRPIGGELLLL